MCLYSRHAIQLLVPIQSATRGVHAQRLHSACGRPFIVLGVLQGMVEKVRYCSIERLYPRFHFDAPIRVQGKAIGKKPAIGRIIEISACGLSAVLARRLDPGEIVELQFVLNGLEIRVRAAVRNRNDARYGFEFLSLSAEQRRHIEAATRVLAAAPEEN
jgi:PilZ domain